jgi:hypothetical protein
VDAKVLFVELVLHGVEGARAIEPAEGFRLDVEVASVIQRVMLPTECDDSFVRRAVAGRIPAHAAMLFVTGIDRIPTVPELAAWHAALVAVARLALPHDLLLALDLKTALRFALGLIRAA